MQDSHTPVSADETAADLGPPRLISTAAVGLPERLAGRLDEHLAGFVAFGLAVSGLFALAEREKLGPFSMAKGSAFPHARTEKVSDFRIALGTLPAGLDFKAPDGHLIRLVVLFAIPKKHSNLYLTTLAQFLNLFGQEDNLQRVLAAKTGEEFLAAVDACAPRPLGAAPSALSQSGALVSSTRSFSMSQKLCTSRPSTWRLRRSPSDRFARTA